MSPVSHGEKDGQEDKKRTYVVTITFLYIYFLNNNNNTKGRMTTRRAAALLTARLSLCEEEERLVQGVKRDWLASSPQNDYCVGKIALVLSPSINSSNVQDLCQLRKNILKAH